MVLDDPEARKLLELADDELIFGPILLDYPKGETAAAEKGFKGEVGVTMRAAAAG